MLNPLNSISELQVLSKDDRKSAFQYAYFKRLRNWQFYAAYIIVASIGLLIIQLISDRTISSIAVGLTVAVAMVITDYSTKSIFRKYVIEYVQMLESSRASKLKIK